MCVSDSNFPYFMDVQAAGSSFMAAPRYPET